ncbi:MAG: hypothetical protein V2A34_11920 [Lentisphaerota bacterium]
MNRAGDADIARHRNAMAKFNGIPLFQGGPLNYGGGTSGSFIAQA